VILDRVGRQADQPRPFGGERLDPVGGGDELGRADRGKIARMREQDDIAVPSRMITFLLGDLPSSWQDRS
jgi:hypothetical protein